MSPSRDEPEDVSLHTGNPGPTARRDAEGVPLDPVSWEHWPEPEAEPETCGLCGRVGPLAPNRTICASCAFFPLD